MTSNNFSIFWKLVHKMYICGGKLEFVVYGIFLWDSAWLPEVPESVAYRASLSFGYNCCVYIFDVYVLDRLLDCSYLYIEFMFHYIFTVDSSCLGHLLAPPVFTFFHFPLHDFDFWNFRFWAILIYISYSISFYYILYSMFIYSVLCFAVSLHCLCFWFYIMFWCLYF